VDIHAAAYSFLQVETQLKEQSVMQTTLNPPRCAGIRRVVLGVLCLLLTQAGVWGASFKLHGQSKSCGAWISGGLRNWQELDYIPGHIRISRWAIQDRTVQITFPAVNDGKPGFQSALGFLASLQVTILSDPRAHRRFYSTPESRRITT
jgi:hypothetical protein